MVATPAGPGSIAVILLLSLLPLALTPAIPSVDFYAHVLRYDVLATGGSSEAIAESYQAAWALLPNLGLDVIGTALLKLLPPLVAGKVIAAIILIVPFAGTLLLALALNGRLGWHHVLFAGLLMYSHIYIWGFSNFLFGFGLGLVALSVWVRLSGQPPRQLLTVAVFAPVLLFVHAFAFAVFGLLLALFELGIAVQRRDLAPASLFRRGLRLAAVAALPVLLFALSRTAGAAEGATGSFNRLAVLSAQGELWPRLLAEIRSRADSMLRVADSTFVDFDRVLGLFLWAGIVAALVAGILRIDPRARLAVLGALVLVAVVPPSLFGVGHVDDRMPLVLLAMIAAGTSVQPDARGARIVVMGLGALFVARLMLVSAGHAQAGMIYEDFLAQVARVDTGRTAISLPLEGATRDGTLPFCGPLSALLAFQNGTAVPTWAYSSQQPIRMRGPMERALAGRQRERDAAPPGQADSVASLLRAGFDSVILCSGIGDEARAGAGPRDGSVRLASGPGWTLYGRGSNQK